MNGMLRPCILCDFTLLTYALQPTKGQMKANNQNQSLAQLFSYKDGLETRARKNMDGK